MGGSKAFIRYLVKMICDAHIHVGRYYRLVNPETYDRSDFYYEPRVIAETLKRCGVDEFIFSSISCQRMFLLPMSNAKPVKLRRRSVRELIRFIGFAKTAWRVPKRQRIKTKNEEKRCKNDNR